MYILSIYEIDEYGLHMLYQRAADDEYSLKIVLVDWMQQHHADHFEEGMFHDSPSDSVEDNFDAIVLWCDYALSAGKLRVLLRPADA